MRLRAHVRRTVALIGATALTSALLAAAVTPAARADSAPEPPVTLSTVTADSLPTVQVNGVVWSQVIVGSTVYVTGEFTSARPAGAAAGTNETPRSNVLAYNLTTGELITSWAPALNAQGLAITAAADGSRIFVAGDFTSVSGTAKNRIVALDPATGAVIPGFAASANSRVRSLAVSGNTIYAGGLFTTAAGQSRARAAAFNATSGALLAWAPTSDREVMAIAAPAGSGKVVLGGRMANINGQAAYGMGAVDATTGATVAWPVNQVVRNAGDNAAIYSLTTDGARVYGTGYTFGTGGNLENAFAADAATGQLSWVTGCRGDTYGGAVANGVFYTVSHTHDCSQIRNGLPQANPWTYQRASAYSAAPGTSGETNLSGTFSGRPAPEYLHWQPQVDAGSYTGQTQGAWTVTANSQYVLIGGEFPRVNFTGQQGLARFAVRSVAPNKQGPQTPNELTPTVKALGRGAMRVTWTATFDRDNRKLTYEVLRNDAVVGSVTADSSWFQRPQVGFTDLTAPAGSATYKVRVKDALGVTITGSGSATATAPGGGAASAYYDQVRGDGAKASWRLGETSGSTANDWLGTDDLSLANAGRGTAGALAGDPDTATTWNGGFFGVNGASRTAQVSPSDYTAEAWFRTSSTSGGKIIGFGDRNNADSGNNDRHVYMTTGGQLVFGVYDGATQVVTTPGAYNDNRWHQVVSTLGASGMRLYVDGRLVASRAEVTSGQNYTGFWRVAGDTLSRSWPSAPSTGRFTGSIDDVSVYPSVLSEAAISRHYQAGTGVVVNTPPTASFGSTPAGLTVAFDGSASADTDGSIASYAWTFGDGTTGTGVRPSKTYAAGGSYDVTLTVTDDKGATGSVTRAVTVVAPPANQAPTARFTSATSDLTASFNASGSSDPDGSIASYAWTFGDGTTGTGVQPSKTYAAAGTYTVGLTVTDDRGATATASGSVTVTQAPPATTAAEDVFGRTVASGWGSADKGGAWSVSGSQVTTNVGGGTGNVTVPASRTGTLRLSSVANRDNDVRYSVSMDSVPTGGGAYLSTIARGTATGDYRGRVQILATGQVRTSLTKVVAGTETALTSSATVAGLTYTAGARLNVRVQAEGASPTTLRIKVWAAGTAEPAAWAQTVTDASAGLQEAGNAGVAAYLSGSATASEVVAYDDLVVSRL